MAGGPASSGPPGQRACRSIDWPTSPGNCQSSSDMIASTMKMITSHFAIDIDIPATPRAPSKAKTSASTKKRIARPTRPFTMLSPPIAGIRPALRRHTQFGYIYNFPTIQIPAKRPDPPGSARKGSWVVVRCTSCLPGTPAIRRISPGAGSRSSGRRRAERCSPQTPFPHGRLRWQGVSPVPFFVPTFTQEVWSSAAAAIPRTPRSPAPHQPHRLPPGPSPGARDPEHRQHRRFLDLVSANTPSRRPPGIFLSPGTSGMSRVSHLDRLPLRDNPGWHGQVKNPRVPAREGAYTYYSWGHPDSHGSADPMPPANAAQL